MDRVESGGARGRNYAGWIRTASIVALSAAILYSGRRLLGSVRGNGGRGDGRGPEARPRKLSLSHFADPKSVVARDEPGDGSVDPTDGFVRCESMSKKSYIKRLWKQQRGANKVTIPEFWEDPACFHDLSRNVLFFHIGKGGGGTMERELKLSRVSVSVSHPGPSPTHVDRLKKGPLDTLILDIRDPVDRYVSAFNWGLNMLCGPEKMHNNRCREMSPEGQRLQAETDEWTLMAVDYERDPSVLAEALCEDSPRHEKAAEDFAKMNFMGHKRPLGDWLDFLLAPAPGMADGFEVTGLNNIIAVPMEHQSDGTFNFARHNEQLALHLLRSRYGDNASDILAQRPEDTDLSAKERMEHPTKSSSLTPLAECCMTRQLRLDYQLIQTMLGDHSGDHITQPLGDVHPSLYWACAWGGFGEPELCRSDLRSILARRAAYLDQWQSCSDVVAGIAAE